MADYTTDYSKQTPGQVPKVSPRALDPSRALQQASTGNPYQTAGGQSMFNQLGAKPYERTNVTDGKDFKRMSGYAERPSSWEEDLRVREARMANNGPTRKGMQGHNEADARGWAAEQKVREMYQAKRDAYAQSMQGAYGKAAAHNQAEGGFASAEQRQGMQNQGNYAVNQANNASNQAQAAANNASLEARDADKNNVLRQGQSVTHDANRMNAALRATAMRNTQTERMHEANEAARKAGYLPDGTPYRPLKYNPEAFNSTYNQIGARVDSLGSVGDNVGNLGQAAIQETQSGNPALGAPPAFMGGAVNAPAQPSAPAYAPGPAAGGVPFAPTGGDVPFAPTGGDVPFVPTDGGVIPAGVAPVAGGAPSIYGGAPSIYGGGVAPAAAAAASEDSGFVADATVRPPADSATAAAAPSPGVPPEAVAAATNGAAFGGGANSATPAVPNTAAGRAQVITRDVARAKRISTAADQVLSTMNYGAAATGNGDIDPDRVRDHRFAMDALAAEGNLPNDIRNDPDLLNRIAFRVQVARAEKDRAHGFFPNTDGEVTLDPGRYTMGKTPGFLSNLGNFAGDTALRAGQGAGIGAVAGAPFAGVGAIPGALMGAGAGAITGAIEGYNRWGQREMTDENGDSFFVDSDAILPQTASAIHAQQQAAEQQAAQQNAPRAGQPNPLQY